MDIRNQLSQRINIADVRRLAIWTAEDNANRDRLWEAACSADRRTSVNALWIMTHLPRTEADWLTSLQDALADRLLREKDASGKRLLLQLLRHQEYDPATLRTDLLDYCLSKINSECEPYAVRAFCIYLAFRMCRSYPELLLELKEHLSMLSQQTLTPGLKCARDKTLAGIRKLDL